MLEEADEGAVVARLREIELRGRDRIAGRGAGVELAEVLVPDDREAAARSLARPLRRGPLASAALDRLTHGAHFVEITGASFRVEHTKKQTATRRSRATN